MVKILNVLFSMVLCNPFVSASPDLFPILHHQMDAVYRLRFNYAILVHVVKMLIALLLEAGKNVHAEPDTLATHSSSAHGHHHLWIRVSLHRADSIQNVRTAIMDTPFAHAYQDMKEILSYPKDVNLNVHLVQNVARSELAHLEKELDEDDTFPYS